MDNNLILFYLKWITLFVCFFLITYFHNESFQVYKSMREKQPTVEIFIFDNNLFQNNKLWFKKIGVQTNVI